MIFDDEEAEYEPKDFPQEDTKGSSDGQGLVTTQEITVSQEKEAANADKFETNSEQGVPVYTPDKNEDKEDAR